MDVNTLNELKDNYDEKADILNGYLRDWYKLKEEFPNWNPVYFNTDKDSRFYISVKELKDIYDEMVDKHLGDYESYINFDAFMSTYTCEFAGGNLLAVSREGVLMALQAYDAIWMDMEKLSLFHSSDSDEEDVEGEVELDKD